MGSIGSHYYCLHYAVLLLVATDLGGSFGHFQYLLLPGAYHTNCGCEVAVRPEWHIGQFKSTMHTHSYLRGNLA